MSERMTSCHSNEIQESWVRVDSRSKQTAEKWNFFEFLFYSLLYAHVTMEDYLISHHSLTCREIRNFLDERRSHASNVNVLYAMMIKQWGEWNWKAIKIHTKEPKDIKSRYLEIILLSSAFSSPTRRRHNTRRKKCSTIKFKFPRSSKNQLFKYDDKLRLLLIFDDARSCYCSSEHIMRILWRKQKL